MPGGLFLRRHDVYRLTFSRGLMRKGRRLMNSTAVHWVRMSGEKVCS